ncbi:MAG: PAS domain S-box protein, partial [Planctomycetota bacterium]|nr:PAS domain S-box protein [Planctomycetota bacterium]
MKHEELSSEALHALVNSAIEGIISIDSTGNIRTTNPAAEEMLGYAAGELIGKKVNDLMPSPYHEEHDAYLARYHETGEKKVIGAEQEVSAKRKDGTVFPIALSVSEFTLGGEKMFTGIMRDIQDKKQAEAERDRFFTLSLDLLCIAGVDGFFKRLNPAFESVLGYTTDELLGKPFFDFIHPDDVDATIREVERIRQGSQTIDFENRYRCKDGSYRWFLWTAAPAEGELIYAAARDITDTKEVENALKVSAQVAEAASLAKSKFLANMSHEIRTPMNGVMGMVSLLLNTELSPLQREYLETIQSSSDSLLNVINDILDLSRIEAGKLEIDSVPFDLRKAVEEVIELLSVRARDKDVECILRYPLEGPRHVIGDPGRIRQVLTNLI